MATLLSLPRELLDRIASELWTRDLLSLALTCRALTECALRPVYRRPWTSGWYSWQGFVRAVSTRKERARQVVELTLVRIDRDLVEGLTRRIPVFECCRKLTVCDRDGGSALAFASCYCPKVTELELEGMATAGALVTRPQNVNTLHIAFHHSVGITSSPRFSDIVAFCGPSLRRLQLTRAWFRSWDFSQLGRLCPLLESLEIHRFEEEVEVRPPHAVFQPLPHLRELQVTTYKGMPFAVLGCDCHDLRDLRLYLEEGWGDCRDIVDPFLSFAVDGPTRWPALRSLIFQPGPEYTHDDCTGPHPRLARAFRPLFDWAERRNVALSCCGFEHFYAYDTDVGSGSEDLDEDGGAASVVGSLVWADDGDWSDWSGSDWSSSDWS